MKKFAIINLIGFIFTLIMNGLANALPLNGLTTKELSDMYPNLFVPAGFTFSIWGVIYLLLIIWVTYWFSPSEEKQQEYEKTSLGWWFFISCLANGSWIVAWHYQMLGLSVLLMLVIFISLFAMYYKLYFQIRSWKVKVPISVYLGWISVATIANITALLVGNGFTGGDNASTYSSIMIVVGTILGLYFILIKKDVFYGLVIVWALFGINSSQDYQDIKYVTIFGMMGIGVAIIYKIVKKDLYAIRK